MQGFVLAAGIPWITLIASALVNRWTFGWQLDGLHYLLVGIVYGFTVTWLLNRWEPKEKAPISSVSSGTRIPPTDIRPEALDSASAGEGTSREDEEGTELVDLDAPIPESDPLLAAQYQRWLAETPSMLSDFLELVQSADPETWQLLKRVEEPPLLVYKHLQLQYSFKVCGAVENSAASVFDMLTDVERRPEWDPMVMEARILETVNEHLRVIYLRMKPIWPTSSRDLVLLSYLRVMEVDHEFLQTLETVAPNKEPNLTSPPSAANSKQQRHKIYVNVTKSITHARAPSRADEGIVRMEAGLAGQVSFATTDSSNQNLSFLLQLADTNPGGWIPASVLNFVATTAIPDGFQRLNAQLRQVPPKRLSAMEASGENVLPYAARKTSLRPGSATSSAVSLADEEAGPSSSLGDDSEKNSAAPLPPVSSRTNPVARVPAKPALDSPDASSAASARQRKPRRSIAEQAQAGAETAMPWMVAILFGYTVTTVAMRFLQYRRPSA